MDIEYKIKKIIKNVVNVKDDIEIMQGDNLIERYGITSVDALEILICVETEFEITIEDEDLSQELVSSTDYLKKYIQNKINSKETIIDE